MKISLEHISKRFQRHWIFKDINYSFTSPGSYAVLGPNGSGKSTLMRLIAGMQSTSTGKVHYSINNTAIEGNKVFEHLSFCAPSQELVEELTLKEFLDFHFSFKQPIVGLNTESIITLIGLNEAANRPIGDYSSGMRQRVKLAQAIFSNTPLLMLDEPCTNLDHAGVEQYRDWIETYSKNRLVIVGSNDVREYFFCKERLDVEGYK